MTGGEEAPHQPGPAADECQCIALWAIKRARFDFTMIVLFGADVGTQAARLHRLGSTPHPTRTVAPVAL